MKLLNKLKNHIIKLVRSNFNYLENLDNLNIVMEDALNQLTLESTGVQQKLMQELNIKENEDQIKE